MLVIDLLRGFGAVLAVVLSPFLIGAIIQISREWGIRGRAIQETAEAVVKVATTMESHASEVRDFWTVVTKKLARTEFILCGANGDNGLYSMVKTHNERLQSIEDRNLEIDAISSIERQQYHGPEKRQTKRRMRDNLLPDLPPVDRGDGDE